MSTWREADVPDQSGRTALVTGANSGLGLQTAKVLAGKGARVLLACRSVERGEQALRAVRPVAEAEPKLIKLDLADLGSVRECATAVRETTGDRLDLLINNAGLMASPRRATADGFELQFGTNHLGHAALTWLLMPAVRGGHGPRIITLTSFTSISARLDLGDPNFEHHRYHRAIAYGQSKLANQVFALELDRRLRAAHEEVISVTAAPGYAATNLTPTMAASYPGPLTRTAFRGVFKLGAVLVAQSVRMGALPQLYAATADGVNGGDYIAPRIAQLRGYPTFVKPLRAALDHATGAGLWELTAKLTGVTPDPA